MWRSHIDSFYSIVVVGVVGKFKANITAIGCERVEVSKPVQVPLFIYDPRVVLVVSHLAKLPQSIR
jgi:butyrate kinase